MADLYKIARTDQIYVDKDQEIVRIDVGNPVKELSI